MRKLRRFIWYLAGRLLLITVLLGLFTVTFYYAMNASNIYIVLKDGMAKRAQVIMMGESPSDLTKFFQGSYLQRDENLLLADKRPGMVVHADETEKVNTLINHIQAYLYQKKEWNPRWENAFAPALCNRIDRNTGGIVIAAKTAEALRIMNQKIKDRELEKYYLCVVHGRMTPSDGRLEDFLSKDEAKNQVTVHRSPVPGGRTAVTLYRTLAVRNGLSLMECELITGRTHQIRAQFAAAGHPLLGDGKYGKARENKKFERKFQALYSYKLTFSFSTDAGVLNHLNGRSWQVEHVDFAEEYFPEYTRK